MAERFTQRVNVGVQNLRSGAGEGLAGLANQLGRIVQERTQKKLAQAQEEGQLAGQTAGLDLEKGQQPEFKEEGFIGGVRAKAFNAGLRNAYIAGIANDVREDLAQMETKHGDDIAAFTNVADAQRQSLQQNVDPSIAAEVVQRFDNAVTSAGIRVKDRQAKKIRAGQVETFKSHLDTASIAANIAARSQDKKASAEAILEAHDSIDGAVQSEILTPEEGKTEKRNVELAATKEGWIGKFEGIVDNHPDGKRAGISEGFKELEKLSTKPPKGFTQPEWDGLRADIQQTLSRKNSIANASRREESAEAANALRDFSKASSIGFAVSPKETQRVAQLVSDHPELKKNFDIIQDVKSFAVMSQSDRATGLSAVSSGSLADVDQAAAMIKANSEINRLALDDAYKLGADQGLIKAIPFGPGTMPDKLEQAKTLSQHYGVPVSPLSNSEAKAMSDGLADMTGPERVALATELSVAPEVWGQLSKNNAGVFAMAGATGDTTLMTAVFKGQDLLDAKLSTPLKSADYLADFHDLTGGVYGPEDSANIISASLAFYAGTEAGLAGDDYSSSNFKQAVQAVTGGIGKVNGFNMELPRGVTEDTFADFIDDIQPGTVAKLGGVLNMTDERAAEIISQGRIRSIKSGQYIVELDGGTLFSAPGKPFVIDWSEDLLATQQAGAAVRSIARRRESKRGESRAKPPRGDVRPETGDLTRNDGTQKGSGFLGVLKNSQGQDVTEFSVGVEIDGEEVEIPTLIPTLTDSEVQTVLDASAGNKKLPRAIIQKAVKFARSRIKEGQSPFKVSGDLGQQGG